MDNNIILGKSILTNTSDAYSGTLNVSYSQYTNNGVYLCQVDTTNTTISPTLSLDGLTAYPIKRNDGTSVSIGELQASAWYLFMFDGTTSVFEILNLSIPYFNGTTNYVAKYTPTGNVLGISQIFDNGTNVGIGTITPTSKLQIKGTDSTSSNYALKIDNSASSPLLYVRNDGNFNAGNGNLVSYDSVSSVFIGSDGNTKYKELNIGILGIVNAITISHNNLDTNINTKTTIGGSNRGNVGNSARVGISGDSTLGVNYLGFAYDGNNGNTIYGLGIQNPLYNQTIRLYRNPSQFGVLPTSPTLLQNNTWAIGIGTDAISTHRMVISDGLKILSTAYNTTAFEITDSLLSSLFIVRNDGVILANNLPTSSAGLPSGAIWNNSGVLNIV